MKKNKAVTMRDVARQAQVSVATVSRVINTPYLTSINAQLRVNQAIETLQYDVASHFKPQPQTNASKKLLVIDNQLCYHSAINHGIEYQAAEMGYKILYLRFISFNQLDAQQIITYSLNQHIAGILIINEAPYLNSLIKHRHLLPPVVLINQHNPIFSSISFDHLSITYNSINHLLANGHKKIICLTSSNHTSSYLQIKQGFQQALQRAGITYSSHALLSHCYDFYSATQVIKQLMSRPNPPSAIFCYDNVCLNSDEQTVAHNRDNTTHRRNSWSIIEGILYQLRKMQIDVPHQLSLIHTQADSAIEIANYLPLTYIAKPLFFMGECAVKQLLSEIKQPSKLPTTQVLDAPLVERHSVSKINL